MAQHLPPVRPGQIYYLGFRALNDAIFSVRATTNGISAIVDAQGGIVAQSHQFAADVVTASATPMQGATPYVRGGNAPIVGLLVGLVLAIFVVTRRRVVAPR